MFTAASFTIMNYNPIAKATQMPIGWWIYEQNAVYPYTGILLGNKKKCNTDTSYDIDESLKYYAK